MELPLFPLNTLLLPGGRLRLKVFEPRYLDMTSACLRSGEPFGVCLIRSGAEVGEVAEPEAVGTLALIRQADMNEAGVFDLTVEGGQRFEVLATHVGPNRLLLAELNMKADAPDMPVPAHCRPCLTLLQRLAEQLPELGLHPVRDEASWVAYRLVELLPFDISAKQAMLELDDPVRRLEIIADFVRQEGWHEDK